MLKLVQCSIPHHPDCCRRPVTDDFFKNVFPMDPDRLERPRHGDPFRRASLVSAPRSHGHCSDLYRVVCHHRDADWRNRAVLDGACPSGKNR